MNDQNLKQIKEIASDLRGHIKRVNDLSRELLVMGVPVNYDRIGMRHSTGETEILIPIIKIDV